MDSAPAAVVADAAVTTTAVVTRSGSCSYFAAAETAQTCATCCRCYLSSAAAEAIRAVTVPATPVAINSVLGAARRRRPSSAFYVVFQE